MAATPAVHSSTLPFDLNSIQTLIDTCDTTYEPPPKAIVVWNPITNLHEISARMAGFTISKDMQAMAKELARLELFNAADASIACNVLHFEVKSCDNGCEAYVVPSRCRHNFCPHCGRPTERVREFLKRLHSLGKQFSHARDSYLYTFTIRHGSIPQTYSEDRDRQLSAHRLVYLMFPQPRGEDRTDYTRWDADQIDPRSPMATIKVLYQPKESWQRIPFRLLEQQWHDLGGESVTCERAIAGDCEAIDGLLHKLMSGMEPSLALPGIERARLHKAYYRYHTIRAHGVEDAPADPDREEVEDLGCCGHCNAPLRWSKVKEGQTLTELRSRFTVIRFGTGSGTRKLIYIRDRAGVVDKFAISGASDASPPS